MPKYRYNGTKPFVSIVYQIDVEPGDEIETDFPLDHLPNFERIDDEPYPKFDYTIEYSLNPGQQIEINKDEYKNLDMCSVSKIDDSNNKAYVYLDTISDTTKGIVDSKSYFITKQLNWRNVRKIIIVADNSNSGSITLRVSFGVDTLT